MTVNTRVTQGFVTATIRMQLQNRLFYKAKGYSNIHLTVSPLIDRWELLHDLINNKREVNSND